MAHTHHLDDCRWKNNAFSIQQCILGATKQCIDPQLTMLFCEELTVHYFWQADRDRPYYHAQIQLVNAPFIFAWPSPLDIMHACFLKMLLVSTNRR